MSSKEQTKGKRDPTPKSNPTELSYVDIRERKNIINTPKEEFITKRNKKAMI